MLYVKKQKYIYIYYACEEGKVKYKKIKINEQNIAESELVKCRANTYTGDETLKTVIEEIRKITPQKCTSLRVQR